MKHITFIIAMQQEANPIIQYLDLKSAGMIDDKLPCQAYQGHYNHLKISLVINGYDPEYKV